MKKEKTSEKWWWTKKKKKIWERVYDIEKSEGWGLGFQKKYHMYTHQNDAVLSIKEFCFF